MIQIQGLMITVSSLYVGAQSDDPSRGADMHLLREPVHQLPFVPGTVLRGRMKILLQHTVNDAGDVKRLERLFGAPGRASELSFWDCELEPKAFQERRVAGLPVTQARHEKQVPRDWQVRNRPTYRSRETVCADVPFLFRLTLDVRDIEDQEGMLAAVLRGLRLLEVHGIGGSTVRGFGRVRFTALAAGKVSLQQRFEAIDV